MTYKQKFVKNMERMWQLVGFAAMLVVVSAFCGKENFVTVFSAVSGMVLFSSVILPAYPSSMIFDPEPLP